MHNDTARLCAAFVLEQLDIDRPDLLVKSRGYSWKIHGKLLLLESQEPHFIKDRSGNKVGYADFNTHDPWMVARLIQYLYTRTYDVRYSEFNDTNLSPDCTLENILKRQKSTVKTFAADQERDSDRSEGRVHLMMCDMACAFEMTTLIHHSLQMALRNGQESGVADDLLKTAAAIIGINRINRADQVRRMFAKYIGEHREQIHEDALRQWLRGDGTFAIEVMDCLRETNSRLMEQMACLESPKNLKRRRDSIE